MKSFIIQPPGLLSGVYTGEKTVDIVADDNLK
jgi:hypothetical protein